MAAGSALDRYRNIELTLEDLVEAAGRLLRRLEVRPNDGRIAPSPDPRSVRYYQTIGVVDRPSRYEGRRAVYGYRHLLQLLAVKQFQQEGHPLHLIQQSLAGCPTNVLENALGSVLAGLGPPLLSAAEAAPPPKAVPTVPQAAGQPTAPATLLAASVAPGITVTIDPALVGDPHAVLARVAAALETKEP